MQINSINNAQPNLSFKQRIIHSKEMNDIQKKLFSELDPLLYADTFSILSGKLHNKKIDVIVKPFEKDGIKIMLSKNEKPVKNSNGKAIVAYLMNYQDEGKFLQTFSEFKTSAQNLVRSNKMFKAEEDILANADELNINDVIQPKEQLELGFDNFEKFQDID